MLSFFEILIFTTTASLVGSQKKSLWFAFILWNTDIYNNGSDHGKTFILVVICFHSLKYWYLQQQPNQNLLIGICCDLLSFFEILIFTTTAMYLQKLVLQLWFAFILWNTDIYNNATGIYKSSLTVVICFHSLKYWYLQQQRMLRAIMPGSCDLLSFFEILIFTTTIPAIIALIPQLWFAFILWNTDIYNNWKQIIFRHASVVICFHSLKYWYLQQLFFRSSRLAFCCDLLSFFEILIFTTTRTVSFKNAFWLWFAFILWNTDIYNNINSILTLAEIVVICFHSLKYWYLQQLFIKKAHFVKSCDLLSFFEILIFTTTEL